MISAGATFLATSVMSLIIAVFCIIHYQSNKKLDHALTAMGKTQSANVNKKCESHPYCGEKNVKADVNMNPKL